MSYFRRENRFLTRGTRIMVHERLITKDVHLEGPLRMCVATLKAALHEIEHSILIEEKASGCSSTSPKSRSRRCARTAPENWYIEAEEARDLGLVLDASNPASGLASLFSERSQLAHALNHALRQWSQPRRLTKRSWFEHECCPTADRPPGDDRLRCDPAGHSVVHGVAAHLRPAGGIAPPRSSPSPKDGAGRKSWPGRCW
jgi:hypothetical protein